KKIFNPAETERVIHNIQNTKFSIFIDETSDLTNEKWMTFFVRYVDSESLDVRSQLVKLIDIDARDCSAEKLFNAFQSEMYKFQIPFTNILSLSCDNASVTGKHVSFNLFNFFNAFFQAHETRIHLLHSKSVNFLLQISKHFLKPEALNHLLTNITFSDQINHKSINDINLGFDCEEYLHDLAKQGHADVIQNIRENCTQFYVTAAEEIRKRLPVNDKFLYKLQVFKPDIVLFENNRETSFIDVSFVSKSLGGFDEDGSRFLQVYLNENGLKEEWLVLYHDFTVDEKQNLSKLNFDNMWKTILNIIQ
ncbi:hypothetical protein X777_06646, partial [Ooceraea biroi]